MSKQPHEQEEQQASGGAPSASPGDEASRGNGAGRRRSRRHDKPNQGVANARGEAAKSSASQAPSEQPASSQASSQATSQASSQASNSAPGSKPEANKPGSNQAQSTPSGNGKPRPHGSSGGGGAGGTKAPASGGGGGKAGMAAIVLVILLAIAAGLFGWQAWQKLDAQQARIAELESQTNQAATAAASELSQLQSSVEAAEDERQATLEEAAASLESQFADYRGEVNETLDRVLTELSKEQPTDERDWLHAEAAYLLRLANQRLQLERDVEGAAALLRTADARLKEADNPALVPVRRELASELAGLDAVPRVDRTGLWLALNAQQEQIAGRPLSQDIDEITASSSMEEAPTGSWQQQLSSFGQELKDLVTVRKHDEALEALISPEQESYLRQSVRLVIEQAQLALLKEEETLFEASLDKAITLIEGYYDTDDSGVQSVLKRLRELKGEAIRPELPDISGSQQALATFIEQRFESRQGDEA